MWASSSPSKHKLGDFGFIRRGTARRSTLESVLSRFGSAERALERGRIPESFSRAVSARWRLLRSSNISLRRICTFFRRSSCVVFSRSNRSDRRAQASSSIRSIDGVIMFRRALTGKSSMLPPIGFVIPEHTSCRTWGSFANGSK